MSYDKNPYYNANAFGLVQVAEHELSEPCYSFDLIVAWRGQKGYYLGTDSGCSCPMPFENYNGVDDLTGPLTVDGAIEEAQNIRAAHWRSDYDADGFAAFIENLRSDEMVWLQQRLER